VQGERVRLQSGSTVWRKLEAHFIRKNLEKTPLGIPSSVEEAVTWTRVVLNLNIPMYHFLQAKNTMCRYATESNVLI
jgi:hypothetical protein